MREGRIRIYYVLTDYLTTLFAVVTFNVFRYFIVPGVALPYSGLWSFLQSHGVLLSLLLFPPFMLLVYYLSGFYVNVYNKSRIVELAKTIISVTIGSLVFFLVVLLNDLLQNRISNYEILLLFAVILFVFAYAGRLTVTTSLLQSIHRRGGARTAVLVTDRPGDMSLVSSMSHIASQHGLRISEIAGIDSMDTVNDICRNDDSSCVVLSADTLSADRALEVINSLFALGVPLYVSPDMRALVTGSVRYTSVMSDPLVDISRSVLPDSVVAIKRFTDIILSSAGLLLALPVMAVLAVLVKSQSKGPVIYSQERIGYKKKPFKLYKLRSMYDDAETKGPMLSSSDDQRITPLGCVMRKYRLDELPNLWNVLKGDMSIVGPRPERRYYIEQIIKRAPHYTLVHQVRPGLTSWGMVKYGYASDVDGMVERLKYDMLYLQNMSLSLDVRIIYYTFFTVMRGEGK